MVAGVDQGSLGIFLVCAGLLLTFVPPRVQVDWRLWMAFGGIVGSGALALLPERLFHVPAWRTALEALPGDPLPTTISLVPAETCFWLSILAISGLIGLFALSHPLRSAGIYALALSAVAVCAAYTALSIYSKLTGWHYPFAGAATFGLFPNRNHTATFLVVGSVLSLGVLRVAARERRWLAALFAGVSLTLFGVSLGYFSSSRAGIVFLLVGVVTWVLGLRRSDRNAPLLISATVLLVAGGLLFAVSGSEVRDRLLPLAKRAPSASLSVPKIDPLDHVANSPSSSATADAAAGDFRIPIWHDDLELIREFPVTGVGLGGFLIDFYQYRNQSLADSLALHPESDWLMLISEAGIPAGILAACLCWGLMFRVRRWRHTPTWPLRWAFAAAVIAATLHAVVDVPVHRVVLGWWILVLAGAGLHGGWVETTGRSRLQHAVFVFGGVAALALGTMLVRAQWFGGSALPPFAAGKASDAIVRAYNAGNYEGALNLARDAVRTHPASATLRYQLGVMALRYEGTEAEVDAAFEAERLLNPIRPEIAASQGLAWITIDPKRTSTLWQIAIARQERVYARSADASPGSMPEYFRSLLSLARDYPDAQRELLAIAERSPAYALAWLEAVRPEIAHGGLVELLSPERLAQYAPAQRRRLLAFWDAHGDHATLDRFIEEHPEWQTEAQPLHWERLVAAGRYEDATREAAKARHISLELPPRDQPGQSLSAIPLSSADPAALFEQAWRTRNDVAARRILQEATSAAGGEPIAPELWRLKAALAIHDSEWPAAWQCLSQYLQTQPVQ